MEREGRRRLVGLVVGVLIGVLVAGLATVPILLSQIRTTQLEGTPTGKRLLASSDRILDCTEAGDSKATPATPPGDCYRQNQKRTAELLRQVLGDNIVVAVCATAVPSGLPLEQAIEQVTECVLAQRQSPPAS